MKTYTVIIPGKFETLNKFINLSRAGASWKNDRRIPPGAAANQMKVSDQKKIGKLLKVQLKDVRISNMIYIRYHFYEPNKNRDKDNVAAYFHKIFQDTLVNLKIIGNDGWAWIDGFSDDFSVSTDNPRIEIVIEERERDRC